MHARTTKYRSKLEQRHKPTDASDQLQRVKYHQANSTLIRFLLGAGKARLSSKQECNISNAAADTAIAQPAMHQR
jgi:hypothetical protein